MKIGIFDSGLGGLLTLKAVVKALPQYDYVYYGDTANLPYGDKSEAEVFRLTKAAISELFARDCVVVIVACNTASAETVRLLQDTYVKKEFPDRRVLGVIIPTVEQLVENKTTRALLIGTRRTIDSGKYDRELEKLTPSLRLETVATPELVPLIESHQLEQAAEVAAAVIHQVARVGDSVILGCTHYSLLKERLRTEFPEITFISQDEVIPAKLADYLLRHPEITSRLTTMGERTIVLSEHRPDYDRLTADFLNGAYLPEEE